ncbi:hypothetical protein [Nitratidesulfovibrio sp. 1201_IL3209]
MSTITTNNGRGSTRYKLVTTDAREIIVSAGDDVYINTYVNGEVA